MRQAMLLFAIFFLSVLMAAAQTSANANGQGTTNNDNSAAQSVPSANQPATPPAPPSVSVTDQTQANTSPTAPAATPGNAPANGAPVDQRIVTPPSVSLGESSTSPVGASNATPGNQAGATNSTLAPNSSGMQVSNPNATTPVLPNINTSASASSANASSTATNVGVVGYPGMPDSAWSLGETDGSVAEAARRYRTAKATQHPHTYTNDDIARLNQNAAPQVPNNSNQPPATNPSTMPASDVTTPQSSAPPTNDQAPPTAANPPVQKKSPFASKPAPPQN